ncbi:hypothetical protein G3480_13125 [Thiorhodococcus mannitoliphagus]|uniref:Uncharacterized protein n=1 Tax=Thiorhodococcus mannitoliphagus TaxID=329406 RepID=A0A6P1E0F0_9GAMM|nr:hypothetical protein [Thiorhodococcus mannitoliphagus]NEX21245.1 hypothetical protein [Thiorhodococcus mannitoliphagus]
MPFIGVLPERKHVFRPEPRAEVAVSDAAAWRLNPGHRHLYDKLDLALSAGLLAAPCGVSPMEFGLTAEDEVFVKPIVNLAGMSLKARTLRADAVPPEPGSFWCERLEGTHTSTDCLVQDGRVLWLAHTRGAAEKNASRSVYWEVGVALPELDAQLTRWAAEQLAGYTGLCNIELIGGRPIEAHLRGSNGFFDFYGPDFMRSWVALVDHEPFEIPPPVPGGLIISIFGDGDLSAEQRRLINAAGVAMQPDPQTPDRIAILRCHDREIGFQLCGQLGLVVS